MDSYLSAIDNYIQEENKTQQQAFYLNQVQPSTHHELSSSCWSTPPATNPYMSPAMPTPQQCIYTSNMTNYQQQTLMSPSHPPALPQSTSDLPETPIKIRKKPGRRPNPASLTNRKEQNRAAQRAFRERRERRLRDLENNIQVLKEQHQTTIKDLKKTKQELEESQTENWYLKGVLLTLQFMCMYHNIGLPPHSPYLSEETLAKMAKTHPYSVESYVRTYTHLKQHINTDHSNNNSTTSSPSSNSIPTPPLDDEMKSAAKTNEDSIGYHEHHPSSPLAEPICKQDVPENSNHTTMSKISAIQHIRIQSTLAPIYNTYQPSERLQPTPLQRAIPHDARIDLIPCPLMRDRLIIFRDHMNYDECFNAILEGATYLGGDPTRSQNWQLPPSFYREYWFLSSKYDDVASSSNGWARMNLLSSTFPSPHGQTTAPPIPWIDGDSHYLPPLSGLIFQQQQQQQQPLYNASSETSAGLPYIRR